MRTRSFSVVFLASLSIFLCSCGKPPGNCPGFPRAALDCTDSFQYGAECISQPEYSAKGEDDQVALYAQACRCLLPGSCR